MDQQGKDRQKRKISTKKAIVVTRGSIQRLGVLLTADRLAVTLLETNAQAHPMATHELLKFAEGEPLFANERTLKAVM